jgi:hypothetical protein
MWFFPFDEDMIYQNALWMIYWIDGVFILMAISMASLSKHWRLPGLVNIQIAIEHGHRNS